MREDYTSCMFKHTCTSIAISCIDYRFQDYIENWLHENVGEHKYDHVSLAGGVFDFYTILRQVEISNKLHKIQRVILMNHEDCGAYGAEGNYERHVHDLKEAERKIEALFPHLEVDILYVHLDGTFEDVSNIS